jgi:hypothetical protein
MLDSYVFSFVPLGVTIKEKTMKNLIITILVGLIIIMGQMDITPNEALYLIQHTLPNYIKYKLI